MFRTFRHHLSVVAAAAMLQLALLAAPPAGAVVLNLDDSNCAKWVLGDPVGNTQTLTCAQLGTPTCSISGPSSGVTGGQVTLTATCSPGPVTYAWTGTSCTTASCNVSSASDGTLTYSVVATNAAGPSPSASKTVAWSATPVATAPSNCTLTATPANAPATVGGTVTLQAACSGGDAVTQWTWTGPNVESGVTAGGVTSQSTILLTSGTVTFTVQGQNAGGLGPVVSKSLTVADAGGAPPPSGDAVITSCPGYTAAQTKVMDVQIPASGFIKYITSQSGLFRNGAPLGFGPNDVMVVVFKAPPADPAWQLTFVQTGDSVYGPAATRTIVLSKKPCDFAYPTKSADAIWADEAPGLGLTLASGTTNSPYSRYLLVPGQEYYLMIRNKTSTGGGCSSLRCDISFATSNNAP